MIHELDNEGNREEIDCNKKNENIVLRELVQTSLQLEPV